ncbi:MAG: recombinase family protein [Alphaproteobacteria bacterium]|nr:recombinase family protein [Alphaproteobacteria bacterium]
MRAAIYARYSSDNQRDASIEDQVRLCKARIDHEGWQLASTYSDRAISGSSTFLRPGYQKLLEEARAGAFDVVLAEGLDRLSRDQEDVAALYKHLTFAGIQLFTIAEGEVSELHVGLKGTMNALYIKDLAIKTHRGLEGRVRKGRSGGGNSYGYDVVPGTDDDRGARKINDSEVKIIRRIFASYSDGRSPRRIAYELNAEGIAGPRSADWTQSTINGNAVRGTGILNNELYIGRLVWNRLRYMKDPTTGKRISRLNPRDKWIIEDVPDLRVVDQDVWDSVKARQKDVSSSPKHKASLKPLWDRRRPRYLFSGLMKCGACGGGYSKISATLFGCSTARNKGTCGNRLNIRRDVLEATILNGLKEHLMDPELFKEFADEFVREMNRLRGGETQLQNERQRDLTRCESRLRKLVEAIADGVPHRTLRAELEKLEARREQLEREIRSGAEPKPLIHPNLAELYRKKVVELETLLTEDGAEAEAVQLVRGLVEEITLSPEAGELRVDLKGDLAAILAIASNKKPAGESPDGLAQVKLVAGAGSQRESPIRYAEI